MNGAAVKPSSDFSAASSAGASAPSRALDSAANAGRGLLFGGLPPVLRVARSEDREVARGLRGGLGAARGEVVLDAVAGILQQVAQPRLVGVEQVLVDGLGRDLGGDLAAAELVERERRLARPGA